MKDTARNCLVIPDIHQNIRWAEAILKREAASADRIVVLGDYFDPKVDTAAGVAETCIYLSQVKNRYAAPFSFLIGNHDLPYVYDLQNNRRPGPREANPYFNGAYNPYLSESIKPHLPADFLEELEPFVLVQGWILSHAGIHPRHLPSEGAPGLEALYQMLRAQIRRLPHEKPEELAAIGAARGGLDPHGGVLWQDWYQEFEDSLEWPQIVGHTLIPEPNQKGRSWDLDTRCGSYGILAAGELEIRSLPKE